MDSIIIILIIKGCGENIIKGRGKYIRIIVIVIMNIMGSYYSVLYIINIGFNSVNFFNNIVFYNYEYICM